MSKGEATRRLILDQALELSSELGLEALSIGVLAKRVGMSKSGLYAHFDSKEALQVQVLHAASSRFVDVVIAPALKEPRGLPRLTALFELWMRWDAEELSGGCPFMSGAVEFDDRPGVVRDTLRGHLRDLLDVVARAARISVEERHLRADLDVELFAFRMWGLLLSYQQYQRMLDHDNAVGLARTAFDELLQASRA